GQGGGGGGGERRGGSAGEHRPLAPDGRPARDPACAAGVAHQAVALDADRVLALGLLDGDVAGNVGRVAQAVVAVPVRAGAPSARHELVVVVMAQDRPVTNDV